MGAINRMMIGRLQRRLALATDDNTRVEIDRRLAYYEVAEERGEPICLPWHWLAIPAMIGAFFLPQPWAAAISASAGIWLGFGLKG